MGGKVSNQVDSNKVTDNLTRHMTFPPPPRKPRPLWHARKPFSTSFVPQLINHISLASLINHCSTHLILTGKNAFQFCLLWKEEVRNRKMSRVLSSP